MKWTIFNWSTKKNLECLIKINYHIKNRSPVIKILPQFIEKLTEVYRFEYVAKNGKNNQWISQKGK